MKKIKINYLNQFSELEIQYLINFLETKIIELFYEKFDLHYIRKPLFSTEKIIDQISELNNLRTISFDTINDYQIYNLYNYYDLFFIKKLSDLNLENNHGLFSKLNYIVRDSEIDTNNSLEKNILFIEMRSDNKENFVEKMQILGIQIYQLIYDLFFEMHLVNRKIKIDIPKANKVAFLDKIEYEKTNQNYKSFINQITLKHGVVSVLEELEDNEENFLNIKEKFSFYYFSKYIKENLKFFEICKRKKQSEILLKMQKNIKNKLELENLSKIIEDFKYQTINIKINLDYLILMVLNIASVFEIQSNKNNKEVNEFIDRSKLNTF